MPWTKFRPITYVTATPLAATPVDGAEIYYRADPANGVVWHLRYNATSGSVYKWEYVGGMELYNEVTTTQSTGSGSYTALATAGPSIALPLAGDYIVSIGCGADATSNISHAAFMSYDIGGTAAVDADAATKYARNDYSSVNFTRTRRKTGLSAVTLTAKYRTDTATVNFASRWMAVRPIRVSF